MRRVRATTLAAFAHQDLPFEELAETLERERALKPAALAQVMIMLQNATLRPMASSATRARFRGGQSEHADASGDDNNIRCYLDAAGKARMVLSGLVSTSRIFSTPRTIDRLLRDFQKVLEQMVTQPERPISAIRVSRWKTRGGK